jgi:hypothetical protein
MEHEKHRISKQSSDSEECLLFFSAVKVSWFSFLLCQIRKH